MQKHYEKIVVKNSTKKRLARVVIVKDLILNCDWYQPDYMTVSETDTGRAVIDIDEEQQQCRVVIGKEKAAKLRDWLNEFLGEA